MSNRLRTRALSPALGAEILDVDLSQKIDDALFDAIYSIFLETKVILFRDQNLSPAAQVAFGRRFGELQVHVMNQYHADGHPELYRLSNLDANGKPSGKHPDQGTLEWHTDGSWQRITGQATILYSEAIPAAGGETHFCDMCAAYDALSEAEQRALAPLRAVHNLDFSRSRRHGHEPMSEAQRSATPPVDHPVVRTHPQTGRRLIYLGDHAESIVGMDYEQGRALIERLNANAIAPERSYAHRWRPGELMAWDNRAVLHRATPYDVSGETRVIRRCTVLGEVPQA